MGPEGPRALIGSYRVEKMPFQPEVKSLRPPGPPLLRSPLSLVGETDWRQRLPVMAGAHVTLRELRLDDAASLFAMVTTEEVSRFISPPPTTVEGFERFIEWTNRQRREGQYMCFGIVPRGMTNAIGLFQVRALDTIFDIAEWGFVMASEFWGTGIFVEGARLVADFAFDSVGVHRLEARASLANGRGNGALSKLGAVQEGILRGSFLRNGDYHDQVLWSLMAEDWRIRRIEVRPGMH
jgi:RimJ/RimL family protein N-acetyltransferase